MPEQQTTLARLYRDLMAAKHLEVMGRLREVSLAGQHAVTRPMPVTDDPVMQELASTYSGMSGADRCQALRYPAPL
jgi:hypothetical protein